mmetsp:Transcript_90798/g.256432  ORF Transcript_90798/g.256432 Transcript_90798/m.256432 type:complete len:202 (-) Transcript_90798:161-766(-)
MEHWNALSLDVGAWARHPPRRAGRRHINRETRRAQVHCGLPRGLVDSFHRLPTDVVLGQSLLPLPWTTAPLCIVLLARGRSVSRRHWTGGGRGLDRKPQGSCRLCLGGRVWGTVQVCDGAGSPFRRLPPSCQRGGPSGDFALAHYLRRGAEALLRRGSPRRQNLSCTCRAGLHSRGWKVDDLHESDRGHKVAARHWLKLFL